MSGIAGLVDFRGERPDEGRLRRLSGGLVHRGPADERLSDAGAALLVERLDAPGTPEELPVDLALALDGRQPRAGMAALARAWEARGPGSLSEVEGPFALAVWDRARRALWLARDAFGVKPLYWARVAGGVAFSSEIPPLLAHPDVSRELALENLSEYLSFRYVHAPRTLLRDVLAVPPGHVVRIDAHDVRIERWWSPRWAPPGAPLPGDRDTALQLDQALSRAVRRALPTDGPVGVLLSGGLDSSAILYHVREQGRTAHAFTVALAGDPADESSIAARVASVFGANHHLIRLESRVLIDALDRATDAMGGPLPTAAGVLQGLLYETIGPHSRVVLSGDGGDEVLGGRRLEVVAASLRQAAVLSHLPPGLRGASRAVARWTGHPEVAASPLHYGLARGIGGSAVFDREARQALLRDPALVHPGLRERILSPLYAEVDSDPLNEILHVWQRGWLCEDSLARSDRLAAASGLDVRYPMIDRDFAAVCAALPGGAKVRARGLSYRTKWPLRRVMQDRLPSQLIHRPKRALPAPLDRWLRAEGAGFLRERVELLCADEAAPFSSAEVRRLAVRHETGMENNGVKLWVLLLFQAWMRALREA